jgi:hypothetical protein
MKRVIRLHHLEHVGSEPYVGNLLLDVQLSLVCTLLHGSQRILNGFNQSHEIGEMKQVAERISLQRFRYIDSSYEASIKLAKLLWRIQA